jgi:hypothetical protein
MIFKGICILIPSPDYKVGFLRLFFVLIPFLFAPFSIAFAQNLDNLSTSEPTFVVKNFEVKEHGGPVYSLRQKALKKAKKEGFSRLLRQITPRKTWGVHNQLVNQADIDQLFYKAIIASEEIDNYYKGSIHLFYKQKSVRSLLAKYGVPYSKNTGGKVLLLPVYEYGSDLVFWEKANPVRDSLKRTINTSSFFDFILPEGLTSEVNTLSARLAVLGAGDLITSLAKTYDTDSALVVHVKLSNRYGNFYLDVSANWFEEDTLVEPVMYSIDIDNLILFDGYPDAEKLSGYLDVAMRDILSKVGDHKRHESLIEVDKPGRVFLRFKPQDPSDLEALQNKILSLNVVKEFKLRVLNVKDSVFQVDYYGDKYTFKETLEEIGFVLEETSMPMVWKVTFKNDPFLGPVDYSLDDVEN